LLLINSTKQNLQDVRCKEFKTTWQNNISKTVNGGQGDHTAEKMNAVKYKSEQIFFKILTKDLVQDYPADSDFRTIMPTTFNPGWLYLT